MGVLYSCDGCGAMLAEGEEPKRLGHVISREYCGKCAVEAEAYMKEFSEAHTACVDDFNARIKKIRNKCCGKIKLLPDYN